MSRDKTWGGNLELAALSRACQVHITIHQLQAPRLDIICREAPGAATLHIAFHSQQHYSSVRRIEDRASHAPADVELKLAAPSPAAESSRAVAAGRARSPQELRVAQLTGEADWDLIERTLKENWNDVDATVEYLIALKHAPDVGQAPACMCDCLHECIKTAVVHRLL